MAAITIRNLLNTINLDADPCELIVILGRSGAGKTTMLKALAGLTNAPGHITIDGQPIHHLPPHKRPITMMMDHPALFPHLTITDNIRFTGANHDAINVAMLSLGIDDLAHRYPHQLSTGQQQKVALARALVQQPTLMLFDEPLAHVDTYSSKQLKQQILRTHQRLGSTTLYVTHDIDEAFSIADRIIYLTNSHITQDAAPQDLREQPATVEIARHLGATIFIPTTGTITHTHYGTATAHVTLLGQHHTIPAEPTLTANDTLVAIGYPTSATATPTGQQARHLTDDIGQITRSVYMGEYQEVGIETSYGRIVLHCDPDTPLAYAALGDEVHIHLDPAKMWCTRAG